MEYAPARLQQFQSNVLGIVLRLLFALASAVATTVATTVAAAAVDAAARAAGGATAALAPGRVSRRSRMYGGVSVVYRTKPRRVWLWRIRPAEHAVQHVFLCKPSAAASGKTATQPAATQVAESAGALGLSRTGIYGNHGVRRGVGGDHSSDNHVYGCGGVLRCLCHQFATLAAPARPAAVAAAAVAAATPTGATAQSLSSPGRVERWNGTVSARATPWVFYTGAFGANAAML